MKWLHTILFLLLFYIVIAQEKEPSPIEVEEQQLEALTESEEIEIENDEWLQQLKRLQKNPINLNTAGETELGQLKILHAIQIQNFLQYRKFMGSLISIYELQAIPTWNIETIKKILPYITINDSKQLIERLGERFNNGDGSLLLRYAQFLEKSKGFKKDASLSSRYKGDRSRLFLRYKYNYKNLLQYGIVADKDAGEPFFKNKQKSGFDFYSFHFFAKQLGIIKSIVIGDFTVNMGQGLIQWQTLAFRKSSSIISGKRQSEILRPYNSAGEFNFHRGTGITFQKQKWEATVFASLRNLSANIVTDSFQNKDGYISSLLAGGYHRTDAEMIDRNNVRNITYGGNVKYRSTKGHLGLNTVQYHFSKPFQKSNEPYDLFAITGKTPGNYSMDYSYTFKNVHVYGEAATDNHFNKAYLTGLLASIDPRLDISVIYRNIDKAYQSLFSNAFTENTFPTNENGFYTGISVRPFIGWRIDAYADVFKIPWLKFRADAPGYGKDYLVQLNFMPNKQVDFYCRYRYKSKASNTTNADMPTHEAVQIPRQDLRTQVSFRISRDVLLRNRVELMWYDKENQANKENGFLSFADVVYKPYLKPFSANMRLQYFETEGYNSRMYAYENDVLFSYSLPVFFDKGLRWYINMQADVSRVLYGSKPTWFQLDGWFRFAQTRYSGKTSIGSGLDEIKGNTRSEIRVQLIISY